MSESQAVVGSYWSQDVIGDVRIVVDELEAASGGVKLEKVADNELCDRLRDAPLGADLITMKHEEICICKYLQYVYSFTLFSRFYQSALLTINTVCQHIFSITSSNLHPCTAGQQWG